VRLEKLGQLEYPMTSSGIELATFRLLCIALPGSQRDTWTRESEDKKSPQSGKRILSTKAKSNEMKSKVWEKKAKEWKRVE
jgi:hypothetical protein